MKILFIVRGLPGAGKTTLADEIADVVYSADMYFEDDNGNYNFKPEKLKDAHNWCRESVERAMESEWSKIAVANTFTQEWEMKAYTDLAEQYGYTVFSIIVENRHGNFNIHNVPSEAIWRMRDRFEVKL